MPVETYKEVLGQLVSGRCPLWVKRSVRRVLTESPLSVQSEPVNCIATSAFVCNQTFYVLALEAHPGISHAQGAPFLTTFPMLGKNVWRRVRVPLWPPTNFQVF